MNYVIECKNKDNVKLSNPPGVYNSLIQDKILLEEGDEIVMKSAFIDTEAQSQQKVIVGEPTTCSLTHINYIMNTFGSEHMSSDSFSNEGANTKDNVINDGLQYIMCKKGNANPNLYSFGPIQFGPFAVEQLSGDFMAFMKFTNSDGNPETVKVQIPAIGDTAITVTFPGVIFDNTQNVSIHCGTEDGFVIASNTITPGTAPVYKNTMCPQLKQSNLLFPTSFSTQIQSNVYQAIKTTHTFTIPKANYDPQDLCDTINRQLQSIGDTINQNDLTDNNFLQTVTPTDDIFFVNGTEEHGDNINFDYRYQYNVGTDATVPGATAIKGVYVGAEDIVMSFEDATQKFFWEYLHSPYYKGGAESVGYQNFTINDSGTYVGTINKHGGILITNLTAENSDTKVPTDFWTKIMGFQLDREKPDCILVSYFS